MKRTEARISRISLYGLLSLGVGACATAPPPETASPIAPDGEVLPGAESPAGLFTAAQAAKGKDVFETICSECHTTSEFRGRGFQADWGRRSVYSFYRTVRSTMPDDNPGGLPDQVYLDVISYILEMNGHEIGPTELTADSPMRDFRIGGV